MALFQCLAWYLVIGGASIFVEWIVVTSLLRESGWLKLSTYTSQGASKRPLVSLISRFPHSWPQFHTTSNNHHPHPAWRWWSPQRAFTKVLKVSSILLQMRKLKQREVNIYIGLTSSLWLAQNVPGFKTERSMSQEPLLRPRQNGTTGHPSCPGHKARTLDSKHMPATCSTASWGSSKVSDPPFGRPL